MHLERAAVSSRRVFHPAEESLAPLEGAQCRGAMISRERSRSRDRPAEMDRDVAKAMDLKGQVLLQSVDKVIHDLDIVEGVLGSAMRNWATCGSGHWVVTSAEILDIYLQASGPVMDDALDDVLFAERAMPNSTAR